MKKAVGIFISLLMVVFLQPSGVASTQSEKSIVIIDTAVNTNLPELKDRVIHEVCWVQSGTCANGKTFDEGPKSANLLETQTYTNGFEHGTIMALVAAQVNPDVRIIFIRVAGTLSNGKMGSFSDVSVTRALSWVSSNKDKYNIVSVSASVGSTAYNKTNPYCPIKATHKDLIGHIDSLMSRGVAVMFAAGNNRDKLRVNFPACIPQAIAVSAVNRYSVTDGWVVSSLVNTGPDTDFYALGSYNTAIRDTGIFGQTSPATAALSAYWSKVYKGSYDSTYSHLQSIMQKTTKGTTLTSSLVDVLK
jgi:hypothetical protein